MPFPLLIGWWRKKKKVGGGYFFCPTCRARKPCTQYSNNRYLSLFFIPLLPLTNDGDRYECEGCHQQFDPEARFPYDFGDHANPKIWTCSRCRANNPSHAHYCQACGGS
jgi:hypothetical protein